MGRRGDALKKIFTYEEAAALLPEVQRLTEDAVREVEGLGEIDAPADPRNDLTIAYQAIVGRWAAAVIEAGVEVKGLWLIDFDSGSGYYCWQYPEPGLQFFHGYEEGFGARVQLN